VAADETPDGYRMCPRCGHHTSAFCGACTVIVPVPGAFGDDGFPNAFGYCGCDCMEATEGRSLADVIAEAVRGREGRTP